jgi:hypothetical protein
VGSPVAVEQAPAAVAGNIVNLAPATGLDSRPSFAAEGAQRLDSAVVVGELGYLAAHHSI